MLDVRGWLQAAALQPRATAVEPRVVTDNHKSHSRPVGGSVADAGAPPVHYGLMLVV